MSTKRYQCASIAITKEKFVVLGGWDDEFIPLDTNEIYDNETKQWKDIPFKMSGGRHGCLAWYLNNRIYVIGSLDEQAGKSMDVLDLKKNGIHKVINMNHHRYYAALAGLKEKLYLFAGYHTKSLAEMLDTKTNKWETLPNIPSPKHYCYATLVGDLLFVFGHDSALRGLL